MQFSAVQKFVQKSEVLNFEIDLDQLSCIIEATKPKRQNKMSSYIRILTGVAGRAGLCTNSEKCIFKNSQYVKRVFGGGPQLSKFFVQEAGWILSQIHSNFTDAEIVALLDFCGHYHDLLTQDKKFGAKARKFIQNQTAAHKIVMRA